MEISIIVAIAQDNVIGSKNKLPWYISEDLKRFKSLTTGHNILMGQKTFKSIGRVLPNRTNIILSRNKKLKVPNAHVFSSIKKALEFATKNNEKELFVVGGGIIYKELLPLATTIYITVVNKKFDGDVYFPKIDNKKWIEVFSEKHLENDPPFEFKILKRKLLN